MFARTPPPLSTQNAAADHGFDQKIWSELSPLFQGEVHLGLMQRTLYATDASAYRELPAAVVYPKVENDLLALVDFARKHNLGLIPRTAGTSLAGQVVGSGVVVDMSLHMNKILELNIQERWVSVQPGVIRDELNRYLAPHGLYFGPETSTANRAMIGGMVGNNSCGSNSVVYGSTREHVRMLRAILSDGKVVCFDRNSPLTAEQAAMLSGIEADVYRLAQQWLNDKELLEEIAREFPKMEIPRRNTGYALDKWLSAEGSADFCGLLCGSEGTLALVTEIVLNLEPLPPRHKALICAHFDSLDESLRANLVALKHQPSAVELMDHYLLDCTRDSLSQSPNRFFLRGEPKAVLAIELSRNDVTTLNSDAQALIDDLRAHNFGYAWPIVEGSDIIRVWNLRKAGLGLLSNMPGDAKPVPVIEDTAVDVNDLPEYIAEFNRMMAEHGLYCVHYAHAGSGELHLRPILDLKSAEGRRLFRVVARQVAELVKRYRGSLSGEHGDGRLRAEFLPLMVGPKIYERMIGLKRVWDPQGIFNPGKIVDSPPMDEHLRYDEGQSTRTFPTVFKFRREQGMMRAVEQCNGSGDCRKLPQAGGTMCPSYQASREERDSTRARANALREVMTRSSLENPFEHPDLDWVMDRCLSCKGCTGECPSNVDMARMKSEWLHQRYRKGRIPLRTLLFAHAGRLNELAGKTAALSNFMLGNKWSSTLVKGLMGVHPSRRLPRIYGQSLSRWIRLHGPVSAAPQRGSVWFFSDPFTERLDVPAGKAAVRLLAALGYAVKVAPVKECGRTYISKGLLSKGKKIAEHNVRSLMNLVSEQEVLIGLEPSSLLSFRDEYPDLVDDSLVQAAQTLAGRCFLLEDFLAREARAGRIGPDDFDDTPRDIALHGHCHQKALVGIDGSAFALSLPRGHSVSVITAGCCGMAGSFGYEKEHYSLSMQIGEMVLFPALRKWPATAGIAAPGTSCRHQIADGTGRQARHPAEWLWEALRK